MAEKQEEKPMSKTSFGLALALALLRLAFHAEAQQPAKIPRIGYLSACSAQSECADRGIPAGFARAWLRRGEKHRHRVPICGGKPIGFLNLRPNWSVSRSMSSSRLVTATGGQESNRTIPIVMSPGRSCGTGFVASLARPGGNITGTVQ